MVGCKRDGLGVFICEKSIERVKALQVVALAFERPAPGLVGRRIRSGDDAGVDVLLSVGGYLGLCVVLVRNTGVRPLAIDLFLARGWCPAQGQRPEREPPAWWAS